MSGKNTRYFISAAPGAGKEAITFTTVNYLAHAYLSFGDPEILTGNMISDFVKGKKKLDYPPRIQQGIMLHRRIDAYTDDHPATRAATALLRPAAGAYAGAFVDIVYDHFLSLDTEVFPDQTLAAFATTTYAQLRTQASWFPAVSLRFFAAMEAQNWLLHYGKEDGVRNSFQGLVHRAKYTDDWTTPFQAFLALYDSLRNTYDLFFPQLKTFAYNEFVFLR